MKATQATGCSQAKRACIKCGRQLAPDKFGPNRKRGKTFLRHVCRDCSNCYNRCWRRDRAARGLPYQARPTLEVKLRTKAHVKARLKSDPVAAQRCRATNAVRKRKRKGMLLLPPACEKCGRPVAGRDAIAHHTHYGFRFTVICLCIGCHMDIHRPEVFVWYGPPGTGPLAAVKGHDAGLNDPLRSVAHRERGTATIVDCGMRIAD